MLNFAYKYQITVGLVGIMGPAIALLFAVQSQLSIYVLLISAAAGTYLAKLLFFPISVRASICLNGLFSFCGNLLILLGENYIANLIGNVLLGISCGTLLFLLPANLIVTWFSKNQALFSGIIWGIAVLLGTLLSAMVSAYPFEASCTFFIITLFSSFLLKKFPATYKNPLSKQPSRINSKVNRKSFFIGLFFLFVGLAQGFIYIIISTKLQSDLSFIPMTLGAILLPMIVSLFCARKGVFSSCILLIFISELCTMCLSFYDSDSLIASLAIFLFGGLLTVPMCLSPTLCFYLFGLGDFNNCLVNSVVFMPLGFLSAFCMPMAENDLITLTVLTILCSFFALFSAWKRRLTLLKN